MGQLSPQAPYHAVLNSTLHLLKDHQYLQLTLTDRARLTLISAVGQEAETSLEAIRDSRTALITGSISPEISKE